MSQHENTTPALNDPDVDVFCELLIGFLLLCMFCTREAVITEPLQAVHVLSKNTLVAATTQAQ